MPLKTAVSNSHLNSRRSSLLPLHRVTFKVVGSLAGRADREVFDHAPTQRADRLLGDGDDLLY